MERRVHAIQLRKDWCRYSDRSRHDDQCGLLKIITLVTIMLAWFTISVERSADELQAFSFTVIHGSRWNSVVLHLALKASMHGCCSYCFLTTSRGFSQIIRFPMEKFHSPKFHRGIESNTILSRRIACEESEASRFLPTSFLTVSLLRWIVRSAKHLFRSTAVVITHHLPTGRCFVGYR